MRSEGDKTGEVGADDQSDQVAMTRVPKRWPRTWLPRALILTISLLFGFGFYWRATAPGIGQRQEEPAEGFYWSASQYQMALGRLREQALRLSAQVSEGHGGVDQAGPDLQELALRCELLTSRRLLMTRSSALREGLQTVPGYGTYIDAVTALDQQVQRMAATRPFTASTAKQLLGMLNAAEPSVIAFSNAARERELASRTELVMVAKQRDGYLYFFVAMLVGSLVLILWSQRDDRRQVRRLAAALDAEGRAKAELQQSIDTKAQFLSMVSHELRSPLQVIVSSVDLLGPHENPRERRDAVARIRRAALMLGVQLRDLLTIARGEDGRLESNPESFEACALVEDVADVANHAARGRGLRFVTKIPDNPVFVRADVQRISQVLANIVSNAVKYTAVGEVALTLREPNPASGEIVFEIADTGPGLPQRGVERLQRKLSRDAELRPREDGSGVGLSVVRVVAEHLNARIDLDVRPGFGSRFVIAVPVTFEDPDEVPAGGTTDGLVLVVDDQPDIAASVTAIVRHFGHPCHVALNGVEASKLLNLEGYETAFFDLDLPGLSGVELAQRVRGSAGPNQKAYLVAITAARQPLPDGLFDEVLIKPVESTRIRWHLGRRSSAVP